MNTNEELKTRPDFEKIAKEWFPNDAIAADQVRKTYIKGYKSCWTTHVEPLQAENKKLREALENIKNPIKFLQLQAEKQGHSFDGQMGVAISNDPWYLKGVAERALLKLDKTNP